MKQFHLFRLDTVNQCLWRQDARVAMTPKAFDLLHYLVEHAERLVTQREILEALWPATHVGAEVVKKHILEVRRILGDRPDEPTFIRTFPRRGYQFVAPVHDVAVRTGPEAGGTVVGRSAEQAQLEGCLGRALRGSRQTVFISGEAGIGKTTLVDSTLRNASGRAGLLVARGHCVEGFGGKEAYYPILDAIGQLVREDEGRPFVEAMLARAPTWLVQFPTLVGPDRREALQRETLGTTRERMVRELCEALETTALRRPLVLVLEDLHWVDLSTLDLVSALARRRGPARLLVVGTYRPGDVVAALNPLKVLKEDLRIHGLATEIALDHLHEADVETYLTARFNGLPSGLASVIHRHSSGSPLFMVAIIDEMVQKGLIAEARDGWTLTVPLDEVAPGVPETLQQMLAVQLEQLGVLEQRIVTSASVAGERFSTWALTPAEVSHADIDDVCEALADRQLFIRSAGIHELSDGTLSAHYEFRHSAYRQFLYRRLTDVARAKLHRRLAERLKILCTPARPEHAAEVAMHFEEAREYREAIRYLIVSSENVARRFAYRDSILILERGLELVAKVAPEFRAEIEVQLLERIGDAHYWLGSMVECSIAYEAWSARAARAGLRAAQVNALSALVRPYGLIHPDRGIAAIQRAVELSAGVDDVSVQVRTEMLAAGARLMYDAWSAKDLESCVAAQRAIQRSDPSGLPPYHRVIGAHVLLLQGQYQEALGELEAGIPSADEPISLMAHIFALSGKTLALLNSGRFGELMRILKDGKESATKNGNDPWLFAFREAWLRTVVLDFDGALRLCESVIDRVADYLEAQPRTIGRLAAGYIALDRGKHDDALDSFDCILDSHMTPKFFLHWYWRLCARLGRCNAFLAAGDTGHARAEADRYSESALATADPNLHTLAWEAQARVAIAERDWMVAQEMLAKGLALIERFDVPTVAWRVLATGWNLHRAIGNDVAADAQRAQAEAIVHRLASSFAPDEPLRASFLAAPVVKSLLVPSAYHRA